MSTSGTLNLRRTIRASRMPTRHRIPGAITMIVLAVLCSIAAAVIGTSVDRLGNFLIGITQ